MEDKLKIGDKELDSRLFIGTGKFADYSLIPKVIESSKTQVVTVSLRRVDFGTPEENMLTFLPKNIVLMPNTSGARQCSRSNQNCPYCSCGRLWKLGKNRNHKRPEISAAG